MSLAYSFAELLPVKEIDDLYKSTPPPFGHHMLRYFGFDIKYVNLNHGKSITCALSVESGGQHPLDSLMKHIKLDFFSLALTTHRNCLGSYGSLPQPVCRVAEALSSRIEANPDLFMKETYSDFLIHTRTRLAKFIEAGDTDEVVLVPNASHGINTILKNFDWHEGDIIIEGM